ncbi:hypothetical protein BKI52_18495 [marine bacterium AO1-C]|nr:hypothetical protein BKI52_18495 [marine bacterium AO1-C]
MKSYLKTGRVVVFTAILATLTLFSCQKQESVNPQNPQVDASKSIEVSTEAFTFDKDGKQVLETDWNKQIAKKRASARLVLSGSQAVPRSLVEAYAKEYGGTTNATYWSKERFSQVFGRSMANLDGVSYGPHQFGSGHNASTNVGWSTTVHYRFDTYGNMYSTNGAWATLHSQQVSASNSRPTTIPVGHSPYSDTYTTRSWIKKTNTHGLELGISFTVGFTALSSMDVSTTYSYTRAIETMNGESATQTHRPAVISPLNVPAGQRCELKLQRRWVTLVQRYKVKNWFTGQVGGNYRKRVNGAYFWACAASSFFSRTQGRSQDAQQEEQYPVYRFVLTNCTSI